MVDMLDGDVSSLSLPLIRVSFKGTYGFTAICPYHFLYRIIWLINEPKFIFVPFRLNSTKLLGINISHS